MQNINLDELNKDMVSLQLTDKQKEFVKTYLTNGGDGTEAAMIVYGCVNRNSARSMSYALLRDSRIFAVLNRYGIGRITSDQFLALLWRELKRKDQDTRYKGPLFALYARLSGFEHQNPDAASDSTTSEPTEQAEASPALFLSKYEVTTHE